MKRWKRPDAANEMRCEKCGMRFLRADLVPEHRVWGSRSKHMSTPCAGSGTPPRKAQGSRQSVVAKLQNWDTSHEAEVRKIMGDSYEHRS